MISIIRTFSYQFQYQYQYCHFCLTIFTYQCIEQLCCAPCKRFRLPPVQELFRSPLKLTTLVCSSPGVYFPFDVLKTTDSCQKSGCNHGDFAGRSCYIELTCSKCAGCDQPITDKAVKAMEREWHVGCFVCKVKKSSYSIFYDD